LNDGYTGKYDAALIMSQDTDFCETLRMVQETLKKPIGLVWLDGKQPNGKLVRCTSFVRHLTSARLAAAQLPQRLMGRHGRPIDKPATW
jgi:hypothetical protein